MTAVPLASPISAPWRLAADSGAGARTHRPASVVWQDTHPALIPQAQIDHMLAERYRPEALIAHYGRPSRDGGMLDDGPSDGATVGFACLETTDQPGNSSWISSTSIPRSRARAWAGPWWNGRLPAPGGRWPNLVLAVNMGNARALAAYRAYGFQQRGGGVP